MQSRPDGADLVDLVAQSAATEAEINGNANSAGDGRPAKRQRIYADHQPLSEIEAGIKRGTLHQVCCLPAAGSRCSPPASTSELS